MKKSTLIATSLAVGVAASAGSVASTGRIPTWYERIRRPSYNPPNAVFPVVWTTLYGDIAASSAVAIDRFRATGQHDKARRYTVALGVNLIINAVWSWVFFRFNKLGAAALGSAALTVSSADLARRAADADKRAGAALAPYAVWCAFATVLATHVWRLNRE